LLRLLPFQTFQALALLPFRLVVRIIGSSSFGATPFLIFFGKKVLLLKIAS
jgi:hypothetical protein